MAQRRRRRRRATTPLELVDHALDVRAQGLGRHHLGILLGQPCRNALLDVGDEVVDDSLRSAAAAA